MSRAQDGSVLRSSLLTPEPVWLLTYLALALDCSSPVLEAVKHAIVIHAIERLVLGYYSAPTDIVLTKDTIAFTLDEKRHVESLGVTTRQSREAEYLLQRLERRSSAPAMYCLCLAVVIIGSIVFLVATTA